MDSHLVPQEVSNTKRRKIIVFGFTAVVAFVVGKIFGDNSSSLLAGLHGPVKETRFSNFELIETKDEMTLSDNSGQPIFIIDKKSFTE